MATSDSPRSIPNVVCAATRGNPPVTPPSGEVFTISGTGFGTRTSAYDTYTNYNDEVDGTLAADLGYQTSASSVVPEVISTDSHEGSGKSLEGFYQAIGNHFPKVRKNFAGMDSIYASFWFKWTSPAGAGDVGIFKLFRAGQTDYNGVPRGVHTIRSTTGEGIQNGSDHGMFLEVSPYDFVSGQNYSLDSNQWHFVEYWLKLGTAGVADGSFKGWVNGVQEFGEDNLLTREVAESKITFFINMFDGRDRDAYDMFVRQSEEYASESRARVIITDAPIYANSTTWQIQPVVSWVDGQIEIEKKQGALANGINYLYAWDENDNLVVDAQAITMGSQPLVRFDFANGDTQDTPSINRTGFSFSSNTRTIAPAPNGQLGLEFSFGGSPVSAAWEEQRYAIGIPQFETYERVVLWIPSNFEHRKLIRITLEVGQNADTWVEGDTVTGTNGTSQGLFHYTDGEYVWLKFADGYNQSYKWIGTITNSTQSLSVTTTASTFGSPNSNNKFSAQWAGEYSGNGSIFEYESKADELAPAESFFTCKHTAGDGLSSGDGGPDSSATTGNRSSSTVVPSGIDPASDPGTLNDFVIHRRRASALGVNDGIAQIWKDGVLVYEDLAVPLFSAVQNAYTDGYLMGYVNSGFTETTVFYVTKFELYDNTRPEGIPA